MRGLASLRHRLGDDDGSLPFALIGIILVAGLCAALFTITIATQRSVREDRQFHQALTGSDAGVQQALTQISELPDATTTSLSGSASLEGVTFDWEATRNGNMWEVTSTGVDDGQTRIVEAEIERYGTFLVGAFADMAFTMRGDNGADSYNSGTGETGTGIGSVGSNGAVTMNGNAFADQILLYGDATCTGNGCDSGQLIGEDTRFDIEAVEADIAQTIVDTCGGSLETYTASTYGPLVAGQTYCFSSMNVDEDVVLQDSSDGTAPSLDNPVTILLEGNFDMANDTSLNCPSCDGTGNSTPAATALQIYGTGTEFRIGNHSELAAAIAMPSAACQGSPSNAQAEIYGAMICDDLSNQGGWNFHYDELLQEVDSGYWDITDWREEFQGTTSF